MPPSNVPDTTLVALSATEPVFGGTVAASADAIGIIPAADTAATVPSAYQNVVSRFRMVLNLISTDGGQWGDGQKTRRDNRAMSMTSIDLGYLSERHVFAAQART